jgi:hypothetical protein
MIDLTGRHPSTVHIAQFFSFGHLTHPRAREVAEAFHDFTANVIGTIADSPELTVALRKLLESKDAAVRSVVFSDNE